MSLPKKLNCKMSNTNQIAAGWRQQGVGRAFLQLAHKCQGLRQEEEEEEWVLQEGEEQQE